MTIVSSCLFFSLNPIFLLSLKSWVIFSSLLNDLTFSNAYLNILAVKSLNNQLASKRNTNCICIWNLNMMLWFFGSVHVEGGPYPQIGSAPLNTCLQRSLWVYPSRASPDPSVSYKTLKISVLWFSVKLQVDLFLNPCWSADPGMDVHNFCLAQSPSKGKRNIRHFWMDGQPVGLFILIHWGISELELQR